MQSNTYTGLEQAIALAQEAFEELKAATFWNWNPSTKVTTKNLKRIIETLRAEGGRRGYWFVQMIESQLKGQHCD
jgi:hypothetical protein